MQDGWTWSGDFDQPDEYKPGEGKPLDAENKPAKMSIQAKAAIGHMGNTGATLVRLHFEVRGHNSQFYALNPLRWLPRTQANDYGPEIAMSLSNSESCVAAPDGRGAPSATGCLLTPSAPWKPGRQHGLLARLGGQGHLHAGRPGGVAKSFERIHRSNLVGMGVLPLQFEPGQDAASLGLNGRETFQIADIAEGLAPMKKLTVMAVRGGAESKAFTVTCRIDTPNQLDYYRHGGILHYVLRQMAAARPSGVECRLPGGLRDDWEQPCPTASRRSPFPAAPAASRPRRAA